MKARTIGTTIAALGFGTVLMYGVLSFHRIRIDRFAPEIWELLVPDDTRYAERYTHAGFRRVRTGMTEQDVLRILGVPLFRWKPYGHRRTRFPEKAHYVGLTYSDSPTSKSYRLRQALLDNGRVAEMRGYFYAD